MFLVVARKAKPGSSAVPKFHDAVNLSSASGNKFCGVCKVVGSTEQLVACTFPGCSKAYHPVRVAIVSSDLLHRG